MTEILTTYLFIVYLMEVSDLGILGLAGTSCVARLNKSERTRHTYCSD